MRLLVMKSNIDIYLSDSSCWRATQRKPGFSWLLHQIKETICLSALLPFRPGNNASGDNNFAIIIQSTCTRIIIWFALRGILHAVGIMNIIVSRRGNWGRRLNATLQATRQRMATLPSLSCQVHKELFFSTLTPWTYFKNVTVFHLGPPFSSLVTVRDLKGTQRPKTRSFWNCFPVGFAKSRQQTLRTEWCHECTW